MRENPHCWLPLASNAAGGIFSGQVIKYAGGVRRSFAIIGGIITTGVAESLLSGAHLSPRIGVALPLVVAAMYMYAANPPLKPKSRVD